MPLTGKPTGAGFFEEFPHATQSWVYTSTTTNDNFDYKEDKNKPSALSREAVKEALDGGR